MSSSSSESSQDSFTHPSMSFFQGAHSFKMGKVQVNNIEGNYTDRRSYSTVNDHSVNHSTVYHQENARGPIYNGDITGGVNTFSGGTVTYGFGRSYTSPAQMPSQKKKKKKSTRPPGIYYQQGAQAPIHNGDIEGGVNSFNNTNVTYHGRAPDSDSEEYNPSRSGGDSNHGYRGYERDDSSSYFQRRGWPPNNGGYGNRQTSAGGFYGGHGAYSQSGGGQFFDDMPMVTDDPDDYPASEYPSSEYTPSQYPESSNPPSTMGSSSQWRPSHPSRRAGTWAPNHDFTSPPPTIRTVPPSAPASSRGPKSPPTGNGSRLGPIPEGLRTPSPSFINAYPSPAPSQEGRRFEESYAKGSTNKVDDWLSTGSVSDGMRGLSLDDKADQNRSDPPQFPLTPPESAPPTPFPTPQRVMSSNNPFRNSMAAQQVFDNRRQTFN